ncbi:MAG: cyclase family protein [Sphingobacteriales bacterium]|nr:cyclase family protein [Sphingobacteriales bacterium]
MPLTSNWIDVTVPVSGATVVWPGDPAAVITSIADHDSDGYRLSEVFFNVHTGTHIDAPLHFLPGGNDISRLDIQALMGPVFILDCSELDRLNSDWILKRIPEGCTRLFLKTIPDTSKDRKAARQPETMLALDSHSADALVALGIVLIGTDALSIAAEDCLSDVHIRFAQANTIVIEHLELLGCEEGETEMIALPLLLPGSEAAPARVLIKQTTISSQSA